MNENGKGPLGYNRRDFLKSGSFASLMSLMGGVELFAQTTSPPTEESKPAGAKLKIGVIGLGAWGREIRGGGRKVVNWRFGRPKSR